MTKHRRTHPRRHLVVPLLVALAAASATSAGAQQEPGSVTGRVTETGSGRPVGQAQVSLVGTNLGGLTNDDGRYAIRGVAPGAYQLRVLRVGYAEQKRPVTVAAGQAATVDIALATVPVSLAPVVTTATGEQRKIELGNNVTVMDAAARVESAPVTTIGDLLNSTAPGVQLLAGNITGAGQRIRIRGQNSISLGNEPIVVIDGIRMVSDANSASMGVGGTNPSRLGDLNPEEIEAIEVVKGPSAATLYGTDAANGVIVIRTKRGRAGPAKWSLWAEGGAIRDLNEYPTAYRGWTEGTTPTNATQCFLAQRAAGACTQDSVTSYNLWEDDDATPLKTGGRQQYGAQVSGGSEAARYFLSGEWEDETGVLQMPDSAVKLVRATRFGADPLSEQLDPNRYRRVAARANVSANLTSTLDVSASTGFITSSLRRPQVDNNTLGLHSNAYGGPGTKDNGLMGYRAFTPDEMFSRTNTQDINRFIGSGTASWRPRAWLTTRMTGGIDFVSRNESDLCRKGQCTSFGTQKDGFKGNNRSEFFQYTIDASGAATFRLRPTLESRTTFGAQYTHDHFERNGAFGENLPPGSTQAGDAAIPTVAELFEQSKTLGAFVEQQLSWRDRLFATVAIRSDDNSAFGKDFSAVYYPKASLSWVVSEESFFPRAGWLDDFRLRGAFGASGTQPGANDAIRYYAGTTVTDQGADSPAIVFDALGNLDLKPERATEAEVGFDAAVLASRVNLELTWYDKKTRDALVQRPIAPSAGTSINRFENIGAVRNRGFEYLLRTRVLDRRAVGLDLTVAGSHNTNELLDLGSVPTIVGTTRRQAEGYPIDGYWQRKLHYADANGDGLIALSELTVDDSATYIGPDKPIDEISFTAGIDLFDKRLRIQGLIDRKSGHYLLNGTERIRCESRNNCRGGLDPSASLAEQARAVAVRFHPSRTQAGFMEKADFTRFRELSATWILPQRVVAAARAERMSLTVGARNLFTWTDYSGLDPESNYFEGERGTVSDFQTTPPPSYFTVRLNIGF